jgi:hypothetical protein
MTNESESLKNNPPPAGAGAHSHRTSNQTLLPTQLHDELSSPHKYVPPPYSSIPPIAPRLPKSPNR